MSGGSLLFAAYTVLLLLLLLFPSSCSQTASNDNSDCTRSCGNINISSPFRLKGDSKHCGNKSFELSCEAKGNGTTHHAVLYFLSGKYYVQSINYNNFTIRLVDVGVHKIKDNYFSHPLYSLAPFNFSYDSDYTGPYYYISYPGLSYHHNYPKALSMSIIFLSCENPMNPSDLIVETAPCISGVNNYSYFIKFPAGVGYLNGPRSYDLGDSCKITLMVMVSPSTEEHMTSCKGIYNEIAHGFELSWLGHACTGKCRSEEYCELNSNGTGIQCSRGYRLYPIYSLFHFERLFPSLYALSPSLHEYELGQLLGCAVASLGKRILVWITGTLIFLF
ncbi:hypothetical protein ACE6H2_020148 [Prunus campanulata]